MDSLNTAYGKALSDPALRDRLAKDGWNVLGGTPGELTARVKEGQAYYGPIIRRANVAKQ